MAPAPGTGLAASEGQRDSGAEPEEPEEEREPVWDDALFRQKRKHGKYREVPAPQVPGFVTDTHCHLQLTNGPARMLACAAVWGVNRILNVVDVSEDGPDTFAALDGMREKAAQLAASFAASGTCAHGEVGTLPVLPSVRFIVGVHPHRAETYDKAMDALLRDCLRDPRVVGIGEAGLDFFYDFSPRDVQIAMFRTHIRLAHELDLPLCLHVRSAHDVALRILREEGMPAAGAVLHCFNLDPDTLAPFLELGCYVGFDGPLTFKKASEVRESALLVPEDRLLVETDAPFMTPEPMRGMECGPAHVIFTADLLAHLRGHADDPQDYRRFCEQLQENAERLYGRGPRAWQTGRRNS